MLPKPRSQAGSPQPHSHPITGGGSTSPRWAPGLRTDARPPSQPPGHDREPCARPRLSLECSRPPWSPAPSQLCRSGHVPSPPRRPLCQEAPSLPSPPSPCGQRQRRRPREMSLLTEKLDEEGQVEITLDTGTRRTFMSSSRMRIRMRAHTCTHTGTCIHTHAPHAHTRMHSIRRHTLAHACITVAHVHADTLRPPARLGSPNPARVPPAPPGTRR